MASILAAIYNSFRSKGRAFRASDFLESSSAGTTAEPTPEQQRKLDAIEEVKWEAYFAGLQKAGLAKKVN